MARAQKRFEQQRFSAACYTSVCASACVNIFFVLQKGRARGRFIYSARARVPSKRHRATQRVDLFTSNKRERPAAFFTYLPLAATSSREVSPTPPTRVQCKSHFGTLHPPANFFYASFPSHIIKEFSLFTGRAGSEEKITR